MGQAAHIFLKDLRALRIEASCFLALILLMVWAEFHLSDTSWAEFLVVLAANLLIVRVIHNESIAAQNQFWASKPYRWESLLAAKVLFIIMVIQAPAALAQVSMILFWKFPFMQSLPGLVGWQGLFLCATMAAACLASLAPGIFAFICAECILMAALFGTYELTRADALLPIRGPGAESWIRVSISAGIACFTITLALFRQYKKRDTGANQGLVAAGVTLGCLVYLAFPPKASLRIQTWLSPQAFGESQFSASTGTIRESVFPIRALYGALSGEVNIPIRVYGMPKGLIAAADAIHVQLTADDGGQWRQDFAPVTVRPTEPGSLLVNVELEPDANFLRKHDQRSVTMRAELYLTLFGKTKTVTLPVRNEWISVMDGLQCAPDVLMKFSCRSLFRWPNRLITVTAAGSISPARSISYSPYPADAETVGAEFRPFSLPLTTHEVTVSSSEPLSHIQTELTIQNLVLSDFTIRAKRAEDRGVGLSSFQ